MRNNHLNEIPSVQFAAVLGILRLGLAFVFSASVDYDLTCTV